MELKEVFEPVLNFIKNLQKKDKEPASRQAAKDRLKLVLMQDRASVSPDFFEMMKQEIIDVIKKYIEIDEEALEVQLTRGIEAGLEGPALYANIPIKNVKPVAPKSESVDNEEGARLSEEEAEQVANNIIENIESFAIENNKDIENAEVETKEDIKEESEKAKMEEDKNDNKEEQVNDKSVIANNEINEEENKEKLEGQAIKEEKEEKKTTRKKASTTKSTATKKKTTTAKTTARKKKTE